jgi:hypothetical protein
MSYTHALGRAAELFQKVRQLERDNTALREEVKEQCTLNAKGSEREYSLRGRIEQLERENAALREVFAKAELLSDPAVAEGDYEYVEFCGYFRPNEIIVVMDRAALDAARAKEVQP